MVDAGARWELEGVGEEGTSSRRRKLTPCRVSYGHVFECRKAYTDSHVDLIERERESVCVFLQPCPMSRPSFFITKVQHVITGDWVKLKPYN